MNVKEFSNIVSKQIKYKPARNSILEELETHMEDIKNENLCKGYSEKEAEEKAVEQMGDAKQIGKKLNRIHTPRLDWMTLILMLILMFIGGGYAKLSCFEVFWEDSFLGVNYFITARVEYIIYVLVILFCICIYFYDYRKFCKHSKMLYILATILNIVAYIRGFRANGNLIYGLWPITAVSPSVLSVPLYIIAFAGIVSEYVKNAIANNKYLIALSILAVTTSLMINFASGFLVWIVYLIISIIHLSKIRNIKYIIKFSAISIILFSIATIIICIVPTIKMHEDSTLQSALWFGVSTSGKVDIEKVREETIKSAKLFGRVDLDFRQILTADKNSYVIIEEFRNGFMQKGTFEFIYILSNYGWLASIGMILLIMMLNIKLIINAIKMKDTYGKLVMVAIASLYIVQTICNLAMNLGIGIIAEFNIPFLSGGDASILVNTICIALVLSIYRRKNINYEIPKKSTLIIKFRKYFEKSVLAN